MQLLLELTIRSQSNRELLFNFEEGCNQLFGDVVASCGDYSTQVVRPHMGACMSSTYTHTHVSHVFSCCVQRLHKSCTSLQR